VLIDTFFLELLEPEGETIYHTTHTDKIEWPELEKHEVKESIFRSSKDKALGPDEITFQVW